MARMGANLATKDAKSPARPTAATKEADEGRLRMVGTLPVWQEFIMPNKPPAITNNIPNATQGKFCKRWLQARRARSDAPYHHGIAMRHFDLMANFGFRDKRLFIGRVPQIVRACGASPDIS